WGEGRRYVAVREARPLESATGTRHSPLATRHLQIVALLVVFSRPTLPAEISVYPPAIYLQGPKATQVLLVNSGQRDITAECSFPIANPPVASVSESGVVTAIADGKTTLAVLCKEGRNSVPLSVTAAGDTRKLSFVKDVVPVFTMAGCAGSNCHGSIRGQN